MRLRSTCLDSASSPRGTGRTSGRTSCGPQTQIPGALQPLLVGLPFFIARIPEAPYLLLNVLSMGALALFAWYLSARLPEQPRWLLWGWLFTLPWTLELSTHIINPSYVLPASVIFFVGFMEAWPSLRIGRVPVPLAHAWMGAALGWVMQFHMSWPLLLPFIAAAFFARAREGWRSSGRGRRRVLWRPRADWRLHPADLDDVRDLRRWHW